jgi:hypothetical protein
MLWTRGSDWGAGETRNAHITLVKRGFGINGVELWGPTIRVMVLNVYLFLKAVEGSSAKTGWLQLWSKLSFTL